MKLIFLSTLLLCLFLCAEAQQQGQSNPASVSVSSPSPLMLIEGQETASNAIILDRNSIESIRVYKGEDAVSQFGEKGKDGVIILSLKEEVPLVRLEQVYMHFKVSPKQQRLKVAVDDRLVANPELVLADLRKIEKVEVKQQAVTAPARWSFVPDEHYLNIVTSL
ncbi:hypothetical protein CLV24_10584 [Pontibacter ummariensis]|uniref:TonB-dependent Receptor Plug Domain n=1 Tax=Pontibacter ummariensis TaxID=1610492 RepID=A0A239DWT1_9BACT|nr:hypothetical protein [Pontibacter ummariensis]PRY13714.1 hypothetical protein CLV24_10584 [Pontibacter ummariensis]SNS36920.1 hypothetical protein SAMN06296052_105167 [Pontibacter ummariensis]